MAERSLGFSQSTQTNTDLVQAQRDLFFVWIVSCECVLLCVRTYVYMLMNACIYIVLVYTAAKITSKIPKVSKTK